MYFKQKPKKHIQKTYPESALCNPQESRKMPHAKELKGSTQNVEFYKKQHTNMLQLDNPAEVNFA